MGHGRNSSKGETSLQIFLEPRSTRSFTWTDRKIKALVRCETKRYTVRRMMKELKVAASGISAVRLELKEAAKQKYTLERYLKEGRPFKKGKRILAK